jgi:transcriptional antiterminator RfaH
MLLRSKPKLERAAVEALGGRGIDAFCPRVLEPPRHRRAPTGPVPLFPSYLFAHCRFPDQLAAAHYCPGVSRVVKFGEMFAVVEQNFVDFLHAREGERGYLVMAEARVPLVKGRRVRIVGGPFAGYQGLVESYIPARDRVKLLLELVGGVRRFEIEASQVSQI